MVFILVALPLSPVLLYPFGLDVEQRFHVVRAIAALLSVPIHIYFMARASRVEQTGFKLVIQKSGTSDLPPKIDEES